MTKFGVYTHHVANPPLLPSRFLRFLRDLRGYFFFAVAMSGR